MRWSKRPFQLLIAFIWRSLYSSQHFEVSFKKHFINNITNILVRHYKMLCLFLDLIMYIKFKNVNTVIFTMRYTYQTLL